MKGFLYRDLLAVKRTGRSAVIIIVLYVAIAFFGNSYTMQFLLPIYCVLTYINQLVGEDERNGWMAFASVVPNGRREMVRSKYIVVGLTAGVVLFIEFLLAAALAALGKQELLFGIHISLVSVGVAVLMAEISLPAEYTFGYRDGAFFAILMVVLLLFVTGGAAYKGMQTCDWDLRGLNILIVVPIAAALFLRPSYRASVSACERREF